MRDCPHDTQTQPPGFKNPFCLLCGVTMPRMRAGNRRCGCGRDVRVFGHEPGCKTLRPPDRVETGRGAQRLTPAGCLPPAGPAGVRYWHFGEAKFTGQAGKGIAEMPPRQPRIPQLNIGLRPGPGVALPVKTGRAGLPGLSGSAARPEVKVKTLTGTLGWRRASMLVAGTDRNHSTATLARTCEGPAPSPGRTIGVQHPRVAAPEIRPGRPRVLSEERFSLRGGVPDEHGLPPR